MKGHSYDANLPQLDITAPDGDVQVEIDSRGVLYVHMEGFSVLRVCRIAGQIEVIMKTAKTRIVNRVHTVTPPKETK